jgi:hypothetical protein
MTEELVGDLKTSETIAAEFAKNPSEDSVTLNLPLMLMASS